MHRTWSDQPLRCSLRHARVVPGLHGQLQAHDRGATSGPQTIRSQRTTAVTNGRYRRSSSAQLSQALQVSATLFGSLTRKRTRQSAALARDVGVMNCSMASLCNQVIAEHYLTQKSRKDEDGTVRRERLLHQLQHLRCAVPLQGPARAGQQLEEGAHPVQLLRQPRSARLLTAGRWTPCGSPRPRTPRPSRG
jgi:hypothetical protein